MTKQHPPKITRSKYVEAWLVAESDARVGAISKLCAIIETAEPRAVGEIKWGAPSYKLEDHFATTGMNPRGGVRLVLHRGVKVNDGPRPNISDPAGLLEWKSADRAVLTFRDEHEVQSATNTIASVLKQWVEQTQ